MQTMSRFATCVAGALILGACAAPTAVAPQAAVAATVPQSPTANCRAQTGTRLEGRSAGCVANGRSYSDTDISQTGAVTAGRALELLDPAITVHH
jgi:hypothetical protein